MKKSTNFKKLLLILLIVILSVSVCFIAVACNNTDTPIEEEDDNGTDTTDKSIIISNGDFETATGTTYPKNPTNWSGTAGSGAATGKDNLVYGVINLGESYDLRKPEWDNLANPDPTKSDNVLMIYNKKATVYSYSNSFTTEIGGYYKVSAEVLVVNVTEGGAYVRFTNEAFGKFGPIVPLENNGWQTFTLYIEASQIKKGSISIALSMGDGTTSAKGYAFFDNVVAEKITYSDYQTAEVDNITSKKYTMLTPDGDFLNTTSTSMPYSPSGWTATAGTGTGNTAPTSYVYRGIMNTSEDKWTDSIKNTYGDNPGTHTGATDSNLLFIKSYQNTPTAYGYVGKQDIRITLGTLMKVSVWVKTSLLEVPLPEKEEEDEDGPAESAEASNEKRGAWIVLSGADEYMIEHIDTNNEWVECTFYVLGNQYRNKDFALELWLGKGGAEDTETLTLGTVCFDTVRLETMQTINSEEQRADLINTYSNNALYNPLYNKVINLQSISGGSTLDNEIIDNANFDKVQENGLPVGWEFSAVEDVKQTEEDVEVKVISKAHIDSEDTDWETEYNIQENPKAPYTLAPVLMINNKQPSAYQMKLEDTLLIKQNLHYRLALWVKTVDIPENKGATITLYEDDNLDKSFMTFSGINTAEYTNELSNDYVEYAFYIQGHNMANPDGLDNKTLSLIVSLGSGTTYAPQSYTSGKLFIANVNMEQILYNEYDKATTGTYVDKRSFSANEATVSNGNFNLIDYKDSDIDQTTGMLNKIAKPESWSIYAEEDELEVGIINVNNTALINSLGFIDKNDVYNEWVEGYNTLIDVSAGQPNLGIIKTVGEATTKSKMALKSPSISLSTNSYYIFKATAKSIDTVGEIHISTTSTNSSPIIKKIDTNGKWQQFVFVIETGLMSSASATFEIYIGESEESEQTYKGTILVDSFSYLSIDKDEYEETKEHSDFASFMTDGFETTSTSSTPSKPNNWTGSGTTTSGYVKSEAQVAGIFTRNYGDYEALGIRNDIKDDPDTEDDEADTSIIAGTTLTKDEIFDNTGMEAGLTVGNSVLLINNLKPSYYNYKTSSLTLSSAKFYEISVYVRTIMLKQNETAKIFVTVGGESTYSFAEINTSTYDEEGVETRGGWTKYNYYIKTAESTSMTSVYLNLTLGENTDDGKVTGYALFDNVTLKEIDKATFLLNYGMQYELDTDGVAVVDDETGLKVKAPTYDEFMLTNRTIRADDPEVEEQEPTHEPQDPIKPDTSYLWAYISSIIIAVALISAIVVVLIRKYAPARRRKAEAPSYDKTKAKKKKATTSEDNVKDEYKD